MAGSSTSTTAGETFIVTRLMMDGIILNSQLVQRSNTFAGMMNNIVEKYENIKLTLDGKLITISDRSIKLLYKPEGKHKNIQLLNDEGLRKVLSDPFPELILNFRIQIRSVAETLLLHARIEKLIDQKKLSRSMTVANSTKKDDALLLQRMRNTPINIFQKYLSDKVYQKREKLKQLLVKDQNQTESDSE